MDQVLIRTIYYNDVMQVSRDIGVGNISYLSPYKNIIL